MLQCYALRDNPSIYDGSDPNGIRTRVTAVKGRCPGPLDDRVIKPGNIGIAIVWRKANWQPNFELRGHARALKAVPRSQVAAL